MTDLFDKYRQELEGPYSVEADFSLGKNRDVAAAAQRKAQAMQAVTDAANIRNSWGDTLLTLGTKSDTAREVVAGLYGVSSGFGALVGWDAFQEIAEGAQAKMLLARSEERKDAENRARWSGDVFDPDSWGFSDGNLEGLTSIAMQGIGSAAPVIAGAALGGPVAAGAVGWPVPVPKMRVIGLTV